MDHFCLSHPLPPARNRLLYYLQFIQLRWPVVSSIGTQVINTVNDDGRGPFFKIGPLPEVPSNLKPNMDQHGSNMDAEN